jgi:hypothetical protein
MVAQPSVVPGEYREDEKRPGLPGGLQGIDFVTAVIAIALLAILVAMARKRTRDKTSPAVKAAVG